MLRIPVHLRSRPAARWPKESRRCVNPLRPFVRVTGVNRTVDSVDRDAFELPDPVADRAFADWYRRDFHQVVSLVYVLSGSRWAAEELAQDAFLEAHRRWATVGAYDDPGAWVRRVAVNKTRSWGRRRGAEARAYAKHLVRTRELPSELPETADAFWAAVRSLPERQAQIVALHYHDDRPVDDIADLLGISAGSVKTQLHRARKSLVTRFDLEDEESS